MAEDGKYIFFWGHTPPKGGKTDPWDRHVFSNFWPCRFTDPDDGATYNCSEQFMMAGKARFFMDKDPANAGILAEIMGTDKPGKIKTLGREVKGFDAKLWSAAAPGVVERGVYLKFTQNTDLKIALLRTKGKNLVEASPGDKIWGIGLGAEQARTTPPERWPGTNLLGVILDRVRETILAESGQGGSSASSGGASAAGGGSSAASSSSA